MADAVPLRALLHHCAHDLAKELLRREPGRETEVVLVPPWEITIQVSHLATWMRLPNIEQMPDVINALNAMSLLRNGVHDLRDVERELLRHATVEPVTPKALARRAGYRWNTYTREAVATLVALTLLQRIGGKVRLPVPSFP